MSGLAHAFDGGHVAVVNVHPQIGYRADVSSRQIDQGCKIISEFAANLRSMGVPNYWGINGDTSSLTSYQEFQRVINNGHPDETLRLTGDLHPDIKSHPDDTVAIAFGSDISVNQDFVGALRSNNRTHILMTGMYYDACYFLSIVGMLSQGFHLIACLDATDCLPENTNMFTKQLINTAFALGRSRELTVTNTDSVISLLSNSLSG